MLGEEFEGDGDLVEECLWVEGNSLEIEDPRHRWLLLYIYFLSPIVRSIKDYLSSMASTHVISLFVID